MDDTRRQSAGNEVIWLAGFFDGEGSIMLKRRTHNRGRDYCVPTINITNTHKPTIERISMTLKQIEIGHHMQARPNRKETHKVQYAIITAGMKRVRAFITVFEPLVFTKQEQFKIVREFIDFRLGCDQCTPYGDTEWGMYDQVGKLNRFGASETRRETRAVARP